MRDCRDQVLSQPVPRGHSLVNAPAVTLIHGTYRDGIAVHAWQTGAAGKGECRLCALRWRQLSSRFHCGSLPASARPLQPLPRPLPPRWWRPVPTPLLRQHPPTPLPSHRTRLLPGYRPAPDYWKRRPEGPLPPPPELHRAAPPWPAGERGRHRRRKVLRHRRRIPQTMPLPCRP